MSRHKPGQLEAPVITGVLADAATEPSARTVVVARVALLAGAVLTGLGAWRWAIYAGGRLSQGHRLSGAAQGLAVGVAGLLICLLLTALVESRVTNQRRLHAVVEERTRELNHQAMHDVLTGLPNRQLIRYRAHELLHQSLSEKRQMAACLIDLDNFKEVNDTFGHLVGDELLRAVAQRLSGRLAGSGMIGRLGGDEFIVLAEGASMHQGPKGFAQRILAALDEPFILRANGGIYLSVSASIGVAVGPRSDVEDLFRDADIALYRAKEAGRGRVVVFESQMFIDVIKHQELLRDLRHALERGEFKLEYQPVVDLRTGSITGVEALLRWWHRSRGTVGPLDFIPALEESGLIIDVGRFVLAEATRQAALWHAAGHNLQLAVNVSARQLSDDGFVNDVRGALAKSGLRPQLLTLEITESALVSDSDLPAQRLSELKRLGVSLAVDDFGTGYASISYLRRFPFDILKIDQTYLQSVGPDEDCKLLDAMIELGRAIGLTLIAEGVTDEEQLRHLALQGCGQGQGHGFALPTAPERFAAFLAPGWRPALFEAQGAKILPIASAQKWA